MTTKILLADDHALIRYGLRNLLEKEGDLKVVGEASDGREALNLVKELSPDIVVMDIAMPKMDGIKATYLIKRSHPQVKVLSLSMHRGHNFIKRMQEAGASGYLPKDCALDELVIAVRAIISGQFYLSPDIKSFKSVITPFSQINPAIE